MAYYDRDGRPLADIMEYARLFADKSYQIIEQTDVDEDVRVSTVWLGIDHNFFGEGPPLIFETMIFGGNHDEYQWRWATEDEARFAHEKIVLNLTAGKDPF